MVISLCGNAEMSCGLRGPLQTPCLVSRGERVVGASSSESVKLLFTSDATWSTRNLVSLHSLEVTTWRSYSAKRHICLYVAQCEASVGHRVVSVRVTLEKQELKKFNL